MKMWLGRAIQKIELTVRGLPGENRADDSTRVFSLRERVSSCMCVFQNLCGTFPEEMNRCQKWNCQT
jgi:hypothetical protein